VAYIIGARDDFAEGASKQSNDARK
jgi:hypothetical protein